MPVSASYLFKNSLEYLPIDQINEVPDFTRGLYVLYYNPPVSKIMNVVYIGMARGDATGIKGRLKKHRLSKKKKEQWNYFSAFEVWDNITKSQVEELEGLFRHIYAKDSAANVLNLQRNSGVIAKIRRKSSLQWVTTKAGD